MMFDQPFLSNYPIINEIFDDYVNLRSQGFNINDSVTRIKKDWHEELNDEDDAPFVIIGIALALCQKQELTRQAQNEALAAANTLKNRSMISGSDHDMIISRLSDDRIGKDKAYRPAKRAYDPCWKIGDTFVHAFTQSRAKEMGLCGQYIVIRKVGDYLNYKRQKRELVYITVCSKDSIPKTDEELLALGYLRMMEHDDGWDYLGQLHFTSKKDEERWKLQKIGCFPNAGNPSDATVENPVVSMPFFGILHRNSDTLDYEDQVCSLMKRRGFGKA